MFLNLICIKLVRVLRVKETANRKQHIITRRKIVLAVLIVIAFMAMEIPGIFFVRGMIKPFIFGMPFLYGYMFLCWIYVCCILFYAYRTAWGQKSFFKRGNE